MQFMIQGNILNTVFYVTAIVLEGKIKPSAGPWPDLVSQVLMASKEWFLSHNIVITVLDPLCQKECVWVALGWKESEAQNTHTHTFLAVSQDWL